MEECRRVLISHLRSTTSVPIIAGIALIQQSPTWTNWLLLGWGITEVIAIFLVLPQFRSSEPS